MLLRFTVFLLQLVKFCWNDTELYLPFRIWRSVWGLLDILLTVLAWIYVVCLMLRVQIAEDAMWQLRVAYFRNFVNLKGLLTWDDVSNNIWSCFFIFL